MLVKVFIPFCINPESCIIWLLRVDVTLPFCRQWWTCCIGEICRGRGWCLEPVCSCCCPSACAVLSACSPTWPLPCCLSPSPSGYTKAFYRLFRSQRMGTPSSENAHMLHANCDCIRLTCFHAVFFFHFASPECKTVRIILLWSVCVLVYVRRQICGA